MEWPVHFYEWCIWGTLMAVIAHIANTICEAPIERPQNINKKSKTLRKVHET